MNLFLEATENTAALEPEFIRIDVTGKTQAEQDAVQADIEAVMAGKSYKICRHTCWHGDNSNKTCQYETIKEV